MESIDSQWKKIRKKIYDAAYRGSYKQLERQAMTMCQRITDMADSVSFPGMTGNSRAGVAVGLYQNGRLQGYATTAETDDGRPIYHAVMREETFLEGWARYDGGIQNKDFKPGKYGADEDYIATQRAINFLKRATPVSTKGWSYIVVHGAHYAKWNGFGDIITDFYAELRQLGAKVRFHEMSRR